MNYKINLIQMQNQEINLKQPKLERKLIENDTNIKRIFDKMNICVEIFNNNMDSSDLLDDVLLSHGANVKSLNFNF